MMKITSLTSLTSLITLIVIGASIIPLVASQSCVCQPEGKCEGQSSTACKCDASTGQCKVLFVGSYNRDDYASFTDKMDANGSCADPSCVISSMDSFVGVDKYVCIGSCTAHLNPSADMRKLDGDKGTIFMKSGDARALTIGCTSDGALNTGEQNQDPSECVFTLESPDPTPSNFSVKCQSCLDTPCLPECTTMHYYRGYDEMLTPDEQRPSIYCTGNGCMTEKVQYNEDDSSHIVKASGTPAEITLNLQKQIIIKTNGMATIDCTLKSDGFGDCVIIGTGDVTTVEEDGVATNCDFASIANCDSSSKKGCKFQFGVYDSDAIDILVGVDGCDGDPATVDPYTTIPPPSTATMVDPFCTCISDSGNISCTVETEACTCADDPTCVVVAFSGADKTKMTHTITGGGTCSETEKNCVTSSPSSVMEVAGIYSDYKCIGLCASTLGDDPSMATDEDGLLLTATDTLGCRGTAVELNAAQSVSCQLTSNAVTCQDDSCDIEIFQHGYDSSPHFTCQGSHCQAIQETQSNKTLFGTQDAAGVPASDFKLVISDQLEITAKDTDDGLYDVDCDVTGLAGTCVLSGIAGEFKMPGEICVLSDDETLEPPVGSKLCNTKASCFDGFVASCEAQFNLDDGTGNYFGCVCTKDDTPTTLDPSTASTDSTLAPDSTTPSVITTTPSVITTTAAAGAIASTTLSSLTTIIASTTLILTLSHI